MARTKADTPERSQEDVRVSYDAPSETYFVWFDGAPEQQKPIPLAEVMGALARRGTTNASDAHSHVRETVARELGFAALTQ